MHRISVRIIAVLEIIGGLLGLGFIAWAMLSGLQNLGTTPIASLLIGFIAGIVDAVAVVAGIALSRGTSFGRQASLVIQFIQLPKIVSPAIIFLFSFGLDVWVHASAQGVGIQFSLFNNQLFLFVPDVSAHFGLSITSVVALVILKKFQPEARTNGPLPPMPPPDLVVPDEPVL